MTRLQRMRRCRCPQVLRRLCGRLWRAGASARQRQRWSPGRPAETDPGRGSAQSTGFEKDAFPSFRMCSLGSAGGTCGTGKWFSRRLKRQRWRWRNLLLQRS